MSKKRLIVFTIIVTAAFLAVYLIWNSQKTETPQTPEEIQKEIERLQKLIIEIDENNQKVEQGEVVCVLIYDPVCGVDGKTYSNDCFASAAGVEIAQQGECK